MHIESCTYHHIHKHITIIYRLFLSIHCVLIQRSSKQQKIAFQNGKAHTGVVDGKSTFSFFQPFVSIPNIFSATSKLLHLSKCVKIFSAFLNVIFEMCNIPIWLYLLIILSTSQMNSKSTALDASAWECLQYMFYELHMVYKNTIMMKCNIRWVYDKVKIITTMRECFLVKITNIQIMLKQCYI